MDLLYKMILWMCLFRAQLQTPANSQWNNLQLGVNAQKKKIRT